MGGTSYLSAVSCPSHWSPSVAGGSPLPSAGLPSSRVVTTRGSGASTVLPDQDYWDLSDGLSTRVHVVPRRGLYYPTEQDLARHLNIETPVRVTYYKYAEDLEGELAVHGDVWTDVVEGSEKSKLKRLWVGKTVFLSKQ